MVTTMDTPLTEGPSNNIDVIMDVKVRLSVQLGSSELSMKDIIELSPGTVIQLDQHAKDPVGLFVNGKLIAYGEVVVVEDNFGIKVTEILKDNK